MSNKLIEINKQICSLRKQLESAKDSPFISPVVLMEFENAIYATIEDLEEAFDREYERVTFERINQGLGLIK